MPTTTTPPKTQTSQETWSDWFPDADEDKLGTIDDLLVFLAKIGTTDLHADTIRYWQKAGVIPSPVKRWHDGATRALYPTTYAALVIQELLALKELGYSLQQIAPRLRAYAASHWAPDPLGILEGITAVAHAYEDISKRTITGVQIRFIDADGRDETYHYNIAPDRSDDTQR